MMIMYSQYASWSKWFMLHLWYLALQLVITYCVHEYVWYSRNHNKTEDDLCICYDCVIVIVGRRQSCLPRRDDRLISLTPLLSAESHSSSLFFLFVLFFLGSDTPSVCSGSLIEKALFDIILIIPARLIYSECHIFHMKMHQCSEYDLYENKESVSITVHLILLI